MLINKLQLKFIKQLFNRQSAMVILSCALLSVCGLLAQPAAAQQQPNESFEAKQLRKKPTSFAYVHKDPTRPPSVVVQQLAAQLSVNPEYELTAIFTRNNQQYAVLNGDVVATGDPVADMIISQISGTNLTMKRNPTATASSRNSGAGNTIVLELNGTVDVKKQVTK